MDFISSLLLANLDFVHRVEKKYNDAMVKYVYRVVTIEEKKAFAQFANEQHDEEIGQLDIDEFAKLELYDETIIFECSYCHEKIVVDFDVVRKNLSQNKDLLPFIKCQFWQQRNNVTRRNN